MCVKEKDRERQKEEPVKNIIKEQLCFYLFLKLGPQLIHYISLRTVPGKINAKVMHSTFYLNCVTEVLQS